MAEDRSLLVLPSAAMAHADDIADRLERRAGLTVTAIVGVRDPVTGIAARYLTIPAPVDDVRAIAPEAAAVFPDLPLRACTYRSLSTIRADVARRIYDATGRGIVWAVIDSGVDAKHPHFERHANLELPAPLTHLDLSERAPGSNDSHAAGNGDGDGEGNGSGGNAATPDAVLVDEFGHGTYIAGIIAGEASDVRVAEKAWREDGSAEYEVLEVPLITGMAPECKILSIKVLGDHGLGRASTVIRAFAAIQEFNAAGIRVHGVNVGLDFDSDPEQFACGRSPICIEAERLVRAGVAVVAAAGNTGYGTQRPLTGTVQQGMQVSIRDPGNAELVITVGSTHREQPHVYGASYFSSKGPTLDGRMKPDLLAPGERIVSCAAGARAARLRNEHGLGEHVKYLADSGTSVAAAHVSGAAAALLSARRELVGEPGLLKAVLMESAVDLLRSPLFQGSGLVDVFQAMQQSLASTQEKQGFPAATGRIRPPEPARPMRVPARVPATTTQPLRVMYSYVHREEVFKDELDTALAALRREGLIEIWHDREILPGSEFDAEIAQALERSDVIILLVSNHFIDSDYCWSIEMTRAVERHKEGTAAVVPVIVKPSDWKRTPFGKLTALPKDGKPITEWQNPDAGWTDVAEGIRRLVKARPR